MKKRLVLVLTMSVLAVTVLTGCSRNFVYDESMKNSIIETYDNMTIEVINIDGMAYFYADADHVQLVDTDGNPISYENGKHHSIQISDLVFKNNDKGFTCIIKDCETGVKWLYSCRIEGRVFPSNSVFFYEADTDLILGENGLPKID